MSVDSPARPTNGVPTIRQRAWNARVRVLRTASYFLVRAALRSRTGPPVTRLGSKYGGYFVPLSLLDHNSIVYSAGLGEDASFDVALSRKLNCEIHVFDPTPRAIYYAGMAFTNQRIRFAPLGVWSANEERFFYAPRDVAHVSHSIVNLQATAEGFVAPCRTLKTLMAERGHDTIDLLKLDIEGAEHEVIRSLVTSGLLPLVLIVEFDQPCSTLRLCGTLRALRPHYDRCKLEGQCVTLIRRSRIVASGNPDPEESGRGPE